MTVSWLWVGAVGTASARLNARLASGASAELLVSQSPDLSTPTRIGPKAPDADAMVGFDIPNLAASTTYHYGVEIDGVLDSTLGKGQFRTHPPEDATEALLVHGCCQRAGHGGYVWGSIAAHDPDVFVQCGDFGYADISTTDAALYHAQYDDVIAAAELKSLFRRIPIAYVWDDHDYGRRSDNGESDRLSDGRTQAREVYRQCVPHYPLQATTGAVWQSFVVGPMRVVVTDLRSERDPLSTPAEDRSMMGDEQKAWFKDEMLAAKAAGQVVAWVSSVSWQVDGSDGWVQYVTERDELADFFVDNEIPVFILAGDIHSISMDDGSNTPGGIPEFIAGGLGQFAGANWHPWTDWSHAEGLTGSVANPTIVSNYGLTRVKDHGDRVQVRLEGWNVHTSGRELLLASMDLTFDGYRPSVTHVWNGAAWQPSSENA